MYILTLPSLTSSANLLAEKLTYRTGKRIVVHTSLQIEAPSIRWGNSTGSFSNDTVFNDRKVIKLCGSKVAFSNYLSTTDIKFVELNSGVPERYPIVIRTVLNGMGGDGIVLAKSEQEFLPYKSCYWSYYYPFKYEVGAHILGGQLAKLFKKIWNGDGTEPEFPIRNLSRGYSFRRVGFKTKFDRLKVYLQDLSNELGIQFGRADIGWDSNSKTYRAIEINTAPALSNNENTLEMYADFFYERIFK